jgi:hypothetical protein
MNTTEFLMEEFLQKLSKTSLDNNSGCIMSCAEIWELSQEKRYGGPKVFKSVSRVESTRYRLGD